MPTRSFRAAGCWTGCVGKVQLQRRSVRGCSRTRKPFTAFWNVAVAFPRHSVKPGLCTVRHMNEFIEPKQKVSFVAEHLINNIERPCFRNHQSTGDSAPMHVDAMATGQLSRAPVAKGHQTPTLLFAFTPWGDDVALANNQVRQEIKTQQALWPEGNLSTLQGGLATRPPEISGGMTQARTGTNHLVRRPSAGRSSIMCLWGYLRCMAGPHTTTRRT